VDLQVQYLDNPIALRVIFSGIPHPMRLQSVVYRQRDDARSALENLQAGAASSSADLYCFMQPGDETATFCVGAYGADTTDEEDVWRVVTNVLTSGEPEHMPPPRVMQTIHSAKSSRPAAPAAALT